MLLCRLNLDSAGDGQAAGGITVKAPGLGTAGLCARMQKHAVVNETSSDEKPTCGFNIKSEHNLQAS